MPEKLYLAKANQSTLNAKDRVKSAGSRKTDVISEALTGLGAMVPNADRWEDVAKC
ncbi:MAG TPA: hypothetical protein VGO22_12705 [Pseudorhizobium sp.]|nr:hypothetical protein [Pseudorhizobium sp.]